MCTKTLKGGIQDKEQMSLKVGPEDIINVNRKVTRRQHKITSNSHTQAMARTQKSN